MFPHRKPMLRDPSRRRPRWIKVVGRGFACLLTVAASIADGAPPPNRYPLPSRSELQHEPPHHVRRLAESPAQFAQVSDTEQLPNPSKPSLLSADAPPTPFSDPSVERLVEPPRAVSGDADLASPTISDLSPSSTAAWWDRSIHQQLRLDAEPINITLESILAATLQYSSYVRVIQEIPLIRETAVVEADANFDWTAFVESRWMDISEPVGNRLTTGGPTRFRDENLTSTAGVRKRNPLGGQFEVGQRIGHQNTNSIFFDPPNQGTTRLTINYTQPLLRNAGRPYNTALTVLAEINTAAAHDELSQKLQAHLVDVTTAYWDLYRERGRLLQKQRLLDQAQEILTELERRSDIDALWSQIVRARAAVASRRAEIFRSRTEVRNAESKIRALVNAPDLGDSRQFELIPRDEPRVQDQGIDMNWSLETALRNRPEIGQAIKQIRAAGVRLNVSKNEILPALNLILETYASGLRGQSDIGGAFNDQFSVGEPSYSIGLQYEVPIWNRAAQARLQKRRLELRQLEEQLRNTAEMLRLEVEVAVREVATTYQEMEANYLSMQAAAAEVAYIDDRWRLLPGSDRSASLMLEDLLDAQQRLNGAEFAFLDAQLNFSVAQITYLKALGTLLQSEQISLERYCECHLPGFQFQRTTGHEQERLVEELLPSSIPGSPKAPPQ
jgi:outer membrane protein TolC